MQVARNLQHCASVRTIIKIALSVAPILFCANLLAQTEGYDVFTPICKYMVKGDADCLSAWFDDNLEISVSSSPENTASRAQAKQIVKAFFAEHRPRYFNITHAAERAGMKYALGNLNAGGENYSVTIFVSAKDDGYKIQHLKIERL